MYSALERLTPINCTAAPALFRIWLPTMCRPAIRPPPPPLPVLVGVGLGIWVGVLVLVGARVGVLVLTGTLVGVLVLAAGTAVGVLVLLGGSGVGVLVLAAGTGVGVLVLVGARVGVLVLLIGGTRVGVLVAPPVEDPLTLIEPAVSFHVCWTFQSAEKTPTWIEYGPRGALAGTVHEIWWLMVWPALNHSPSYARSNHLAPLAS